MFRRFGYALGASPIMAVAALIFVSLVVLAAVGPLLIVGEPTHQNLTVGLSPPSWAGGNGGLLGTDELGRSVAVRVVYGLRTSYLVGGLSVALAALIGVLVGLAAGFYGGIVDSLSSIVTDVQLSMPVLLLIMAVVRALGGSLIVVVVVLGLSVWPIFARVVRGSVLTLRSRDFVAGAIALGARDRRVIFAHLLPNALGPIVALVALELAAMMLAEATLSFLGFGLQPPFVSLGSLISDGQSYLPVAPWVALTGGMFLGLASVSASLIGSRLEAASDVRKLPGGSREKVA